MYNLRICHLYPDLLNLYGDRGNLIAINMRCKWRNINVSISNISIGDKFNSEDYDLIFIGGGQDYEQEIIQKDLLEQKANEIHNCVNGNKVMLAICGGYQLLGQYYKTWDGKEIKLLEALDIYTVGSKERMIGNILISCPILNSKDNFVVGFENHSGKTFLGENIRPLGKVIKGYGNNAEDEFEGAIYNNVYCTYLHGSLLPKNPNLTDHIIFKTLKQKYPDFNELSILDDEYENYAKKQIISRI